jgi:hypothetical protein
MLLTLSRFLLPFSFDMLMDLTTFLAASLSRPMVFGCGAD